MSEVKLVITGFSTFCGVDANPTEELVQWLQDMPASAYNEGTGTPVHFEVLHVSMKAVDERLPIIADYISSQVNPSDTVLWIHFGVASGAEEFRLELQAYNEANFRCQDEDGAQPHHQVINTEQPLGSAMFSHLPVPSLQERLSSKGHKVVVSTDPGLFVCNYVYYRSLQRHLAARDGGGGKGTSLFVHVPDFSEISRERQERFVLDLLADVSSAGPTMTANKSDPAGAAAALDEAVTMLYH